jgi:hypothetical protein
MNLYRFRALIRILVAVVVFHSGLLVTNAQTEKVKALTAPDLLRSWARAIGGAERLKEIHTIFLRFDLKLLGHSGRGEEWYTSKGQHRQHVSLEKLGNFLTVTDGSNFWFRTPDGRIESITPPFAEDEIRADYLGSYSHLVPGRMVGDAEYLGESASRQHYVLRLTPRGARSVTCYLDKKTFLPARWEWPNSKGETITSIFSDWRVINGIRIPFHSYEKGNDPDDETTIMIQQVEFNLTPPANAFKKPDQ